MDFLKANWLTGLGYLFFAVALGVLVYSASTFCNLPDAASAGVAGALVAMGVQLFVHNKNLSDKKEQRSRRHLDSWVLAYKEASEILQDDSNGPVKWVRAANMLLCARDLEKEVTEKSHCRILEVHRRKYEGVFSDVLKKKHHIDFWLHSITSPNISDPDEVYKQSQKVSRSEPGRTSREPSRVPQQAVYVVCLAAKWIADSGNRSPRLKDYSFSDDELEKIGLPRDMRRARST